MSLVDDVELRSLLAAGWGLTDAHAVPLEGGMNSRTWTVTSRGHRWVAKCVDPRATDGFDAGLRAAEVVDDGGIPAGRPLRTGSGARWVPTPSGPLALLEHVAGTSLGHADAAAVGAVLGRAHLLLGRGGPTPDSAWLDPRAAHLDVEPWLRPAVAETAAVWHGLRDRVEDWGLLHGDPSPEAFLRSGERIGLIDWSSCFEGARLYDVASAVMYVGPERRDELVDAYVATGAMSAQQALLGVDTVLRVRWAVQASYFARRVVEDDLTGLEGASGNAKGLADARLGLGA